MKINFGFPLGSTVEMKLGETIQVVENYGVVDTNPWLFPTFKPSSDPTLSGTTTKNSDGSVTITASNAQNPRIYFDVTPGTEYELRTSLEWGNATRIIGRLSDTIGLSGDAVFEVSKPAAATIFDVTYRFTPASNRVAFHLIFVMTKGGVTKLLPETAVRYVL